MCKHNPAIIVMSYRETQRIYYVGWSLCMKDEPTSQHEMNQDMAYDCRFKDELKCVVQKENALPQL